MTLLAARPNPAVKSRAGVTLNRTHPLAQGLVAAYLFAEGAGGGSRDLVRSSRPPGTGAGWVGTRAGPGIYNLQVPNADTTDLEFTSGSFSIVAGFSLRSPGSSEFAGVERFTYTSESGNNGWSLEWRGAFSPNSGDTNRFAFIVNRNNGVGSYLLASPTGYTEGHHVVAGVSDGSSLRSLYVGGLLVNTSAVNLNPLSSSAAFGDSRGGASGAISNTFAYLYNRALTPTAIRALTVEPFALVYPSGPWRIVVPSVPAGGTAYTRDVAGAMPSSSGTLSRVYQALRSLAGSQPAPSGVLTRIYQALRAVAGTMPSATGTLAALTVFLRSLAGSMPAASGALARTYQALRSLTGNQPAATGGLARTAAAFARSLAGAMPAASGALARTLAALRALAGNMPAASGVLATQAGIVVRNWVWAVSSPLRKWSVGSPRR